MDINCGNCLEPWGIMEINEMEEEERKQFKSGSGCPSCKGQGGSIDSLYSDCMEIASIMMGDDLDGLASAMDDFNYLLG